MSSPMIARVWRKHALRPHRCEGYIASSDPDFETKAADILGLYLHPPQHAAVLCIDFFANHAKVHLHFTPTYSSWLNQVGLWFAKIERDVIARGIFTSVPDLKRKLMRYIRHYNKGSKTVKRKYFNPSRRITPESVVTVH
jgi:transposase